MFADPAHVLNAVFSTLFKPTSDLVVLEFRRVEMDVRPVPPFAAGRGSATTW